MPCYSPIVFHNLGINPETGKKRVKIVRDFSNNYEDYENINKYVLVPCGRCIGCRLDYAKIWGERCALEASLHTDNMFITLTYNNENCPVCLQKKDFQLFIKRLRNHFNDQNFKYFGCGEYGSCNHRPHYHILIFGVKFDDLKRIGNDKNNEYTYYSSETLNKLWKYGFNTIGEVNYKTCNYTARYILKKQKGNIKTDEFVLMSTRPAIAKEYFLEHIDEIVNSNCVYFPFDENKKKGSYNKYFKKLYQSINPDQEFELDLKTIERIQKKLKSEKLARGSNSTKELYDLKKSLKESQIKNLKRSV